MKTETTKSKTDVQKPKTQKNEEQPKRRFSKTYEAALKLKGSIIVNDPTLFFT